MTNSIESRYERSTYDAIYRRHESEVDVGAETPRVEQGTDLARVGEQTVGVSVDGVIREGFPTPSRRIEIHCEQANEASAVYAA